MSNLAVENDLAYLNHEIARRFRNWRHLIGHISRSQRPIKVDWSEAGNQFQLAEGAPHLIMGEVPHCAAYPSHVSTMLLDGWAAYCLNCQRLVGPSGFLAAELNLAPGELAEQLDVPADVFGIEEAIVLMREFAAEPLTADELWWYRQTRINPIWHPSITG